MTLKTLRGSGGGGKGGQPSAPNIAQDTVSSTSTIRILYGLSEGEIKGLANGLQSIKLDGTPLVDSEGNPNFQGVKVDFRTGTIDQDYIKGFSQVENETEINVKVGATTPLIRAFSNTQLSAVRVRLKWNAIRIQQLNGDVTGANVSYGIELKTDGGAYVPVLGINFNEKTSAGYERSHRINLPPANDGWQIRVTRTNADSTSELVSDEMFVASITEIIDAKIRYPHTALLGIQFNAETFDRVPKISVGLQGLICSVPTNYNASAKAYDGVWNGTFKQAYTTNPAWQFYTLALSERFGAGAQLTSDMLSKWSLYAVGQYCDQLVSDGDGGLEPRYTSNVYLQSSKQAYAVLADFVGVMIALIHWDGSQLIVTPDAPSDTSYTFTRANVIDGSFEYSSTPLRDRHTVIRVAWDNPDNEYKTEYEYVTDAAGLKKYGVREREVQAFGCTSQSQAQRRGKHALKTEQLETRQVQFTVGLEGYIPEVGSVIEIADELLAGRANSGRIASVSADMTRLRFDRELVLAVGDRVAINTEDGDYEQRVVTEVVSADTVVVDAAFSDFKAGAVYAIDTDTLSTILYRVLSINETAPNQFAISGVQYEPLKFPAIDTGADIRPAPITLPSTAPIPAPATLTLSSRDFVEQGLRVTDLVAEWSAVDTALGYLCEVQRDSGIWQQLPRTNTLSAELPGAYAGSYTARVQSIDQQGRLSAYTYSNLAEIQSRNEALETVTVLDTRSLLFGIEVFWEFDVSATDAEHVELQQADDNTGTNTVLVGRYSYPTGSAQQTRLTGGLTRFYRARVIDKLGNVSVWTDWVSGVSESDPQKILDLVTDQVDYSQLSPGVRAEIEKIEDFGQRYSVVVDANGRSSGLELINGTGGVVPFDIFVDQLSVSSPDDLFTSAPFGYQATDIVVSGITVPAGLYLETDFIKDLSVETIKIASGAVSTSTVVTEPNTTQTVLSTNPSNVAVVFTEIAQRTVDADALGSVEIGFGAFKIVHQTLVEFPAENFEMLAELDTYQHSVEFRLLRRKSGLADVEIYSGSLMPKAYSFSGVMGMGGYGVTLPIHEYNFSIPGVTDSPASGSTTYVIEMRNTLPAGLGSEYRDYGAIEVYGSSLSVRVFKR